MDRSERRSEGAAVDREPSSGAVTGGQHEEQWMTALRSRALKSEPAVKVRTLSEPQL